MIERREGNTSRDIVNHLVRVQAAEIDPADETICALIGTSLEGVTHLIQTGQLINFEKTDQERLMLPVVPTRGMFKRFTNLPEFTEAIDVNSDYDEEILLEGLAHAKYNARLDCFFSLLGLSHTDTPLQEVAMEYLNFSDPDFDPSESIVSLRRRNNIALRFVDHVPTHLRNKVPDFANEARERQGILLGIKTLSPSDVQERKGIITMTFSEGKEELSVSQSIGAMQLVGDREKEFFEHVRRL